MYYIIPRLMTRQPPTLETLLNGTLGRPGAKFGLEHRGTTLSLQTQVALNRELAGAFSDGNPLVPTQRLTVLDDKPAEVFLTPDPHAFVLDGAHQ